MGAHLDLEDVAHRHPKAQEELRDLYARLEVAERMARALMVANAAMSHGLPGSIYANARAAVEGVLAEWEALKPTHKFASVSCSNCGQQFGPGDHGYSHCENHAGRKALK